MRPLPDCPHCESAGTLEGVDTEARGVIVCVCSSCSKRCRVSPSGAVIHPVPEADIHGTLMDKD